MNVSLNRQFRLPVYVQLKEQLKSLIGAGELQAGTQLPPANQLADNLAINRNTVLRAYNELAQEGYVQFRNGVGTFVLDLPQESSDEGALGDKLDQLDDIIGQLVATGMGSEQIANLALARAEAILFQRLENQLQVCAAVFECNHERLGYYERTLRDGLEIEIRPYLITALDQSDIPAGLADVDFVTTSFFHFVEVRRKLRQFPELRHTEVFAITVRPHLNVLLELAKLPTGSRIGIVYFAAPEYTEQRLQAMVEHIQSANLQNIAQIHPVYVQGEPKPDIFEQFDALLIRPENLQETHQLLETSVPLIAYENVIDQASLTVLRRIVHEVREAKMADAREQQGKELPKKHVVESF
jgi:DNA-binding transcriptional regulator YhcF (GntR family)